MFIYNNTKNKTYNKKGTIFILFITIGVWIILLVLFITAVLYSQINLIVYNIKSDLFYIVQNSLNGETELGLAYGEYNFDESSIKEHVQNILNLNYGINEIVGGEENVKKGSIKKITVEELRVLNDIGKYDSIASISGDALKDFIRIYVRVKLTYIPVISIFGGEQKINIQDEIKMELLKIK